jgi:hypothetical protein
MKDKIIKVGYARFIIIMRVSKALAYYITMTKRNFKISRV